MAARTITDLQLTASKRLSPLMPAGGCRAALKALGHAVERDMPTV
jgi:hypothetical protein